MRPALDALYRFSGLLSAFFLMMIGVTIVAQIAGRFLNYTFDATEVSGFCMAASTFLGLAYTLNAGAHIRVNLLIGRFAPEHRRWIEIWCCALGAISFAFFSYKAWEMAYDSYLFGDTSPGLMAVPFWIPQIGMALGATIMSIGLIDELVQTLGGKVPDFADAEAQAIGEELEAAAASMAEASAAAPAKGAAS
ncbi:TRAP transporter small permease [Reyranella sp.]|uniref:TRAP transporter small permease n=1 Tax=Reyranella sp. TaxID=1929291 RepID=UPI003BA8E92E